MEPDEQEAEHARATYASLLPDPDDDSEYARALRGDGSKEGIEAAADADDPRALYSVGTWHLHGARGYAKDIERGLELMERAARGGIREAWFALGVAYETGRGREPDARRAYLHYLRAAIRGDPHAISAVANCLASEHGTRLDHAEAQLWFEAGAELTDGGAGELDRYRGWLAGD